MPMFSVIMSHKLTQNKRNIFRKPFELCYENGNNAD